MEAQHLHRYKYLWKKCQDRDVVINAWKKLRKGKTNRKEVIIIEKDFEHYVELMIETVENTRPGGDPEKAFVPVYHKPKHIVEHGKQREIYCPSIWEQWFHHIIIQVLSPIVMKTSYPYSCGSMPKRGGIYGKRKLERVIKKQGFRYFAKLDIRHFFNHVKLEMVLNALRKLVEDEWFLYMIRRIFLYFPKCLPLGFYPSQWFANFILCPLDWSIARHRPVCFIRYMDDYVICDNNKRKLHRLVVVIKRELGKIKLRLKGNYQVIKFVYYNQRTGKWYGRPIDFMGFVFSRKNTVLRKGIMLKAVRLATRLGKTPVIACCQAQSMLSRLGWFKHTDTGYLWQTRINGCVSVRALKTIVSKRDRRSSSNENRMEKGALWMPFYETGAV